MIYSYEHILGKKDFFHLPMSKIQCPHKQSSVLYTVIAAVKTFDLRF